MSRNAILLVPDRKRAFKNTVFHQKRITDHTVVPLGYKQGHPGQKKPTRDPYPQVYTKISHVHTQHTKSHTLLCSMFVSQLVQAVPWVFVW